MHTYKHRLLMLTYIYTHIYLYIHIYTYTYVYTYKQKYTHIYTTCMHTSYLHVHFLLLYFQHKTHERAVDKLITKHSYLLPSLLWASITIGYRRQQNKICQALPTPPANNQHNMDLDPCRLLLAIIAYDIFCHHIRDSARTKCTTASSHVHLEGRHLGILLRNFFFLPSFAWKQISQIN